MRIHERKLFDSGLVLILATLALNAFADEAKPSAASESESALSIASEDESSFIKTCTKLTVSRDWAHTSDLTTCKYYVHETSFEELQKKLNFEASALVPITDENRSRYNAPKYWQECNRLTYHRREVDKPKTLSWIDPDFVLDAPFAIVLVRNLDKSKELVPKSRVRAVVIDKEAQLIEHARAQETTWDFLWNMLHAMVWGHPAPKEYELEEDDAPAPQPR